MVNVTKAMWMWYVKVNQKDMEWYRYPKLYGMIYLTKEYGI